MRVLLALILGIVIGAGGYWFIEKRDANLKLEAKGSAGGERITVSGKDVKAKAEEVGQELKQAGTKAAEVIGDAAITAGVKVKLAADPQISALKIDVDTMDGVVTLNGRVASVGLIDKAAEIARTAPGVRDVKTNLQVQP